MFQNINIDKNISKYGGSTQYEFIWISWTIKVFKKTSKLYSAVFM